MKRRNGLWIMALLCALLLSGCGAGGEAETLSVCMGAAPVTLDPIYAQESADQTILVHLYENLMRLSINASGETIVTDGIAKSVTQETNFDGTVSYTFRLRSARWSDGRSVRAGDFVYAWRRLADPLSQSPYAALLSVVQGYDEARASGDMDLLQVTAKNDNTLVVVLDGNYDWFLKEVCTSPATMPLRRDVVQRLKEAAEEEGGSARWWSDPTALVTNGAYAVSEHQRGKMLETKISERYYGSVPGPKTLTFRFADTVKEAWRLYEQDEVDAVWALPEEELKERSAEEDWTGEDVLGTYSALINCAVFPDELIRQALTRSIDRQALAEALSPAARAAEGLVPFCVPEREDATFRQAKAPLLDNAPESYDERCQEARALLEEAGYDSAAGLGEVELLYENERTNTIVAELLCQQWSEALGLKVTARATTRQELWSALRSGSYQIAAVDLDAVGNDAECFLMDWTSQSADNVTGYANSAYDTLMAIIATAPDGTARMGCLHDAEELLLSDGAVAPLFTRRTDWALREGLAGACRDRRGWFSFCMVVARGS